MAARIKKNDRVRVLKGKDRGKEGEVIRIDCKSGRVVVSGVNIMTKHVKNRQGTTQTGLVKSEAPIDLSNVAYVDSNTSEFGRVGWKTLEDGSKTRYIKGSE